jgi:formamidopyrimidine-DNA glycosylase
VNDHAVVSGADLEPLFYRRRAPVKALLLDQALVSGVGNIYASEALYRAGIHPLTPAGDLDAGARDRLALAIVQVLSWAVEQEQRDEMKYFGEQGAVNIFSVYGREGTACSRCGGQIVRIVIGSRSTFFCPGCQPGFRTGAGKEQVPRGERNPP